MKKSAFQMNRSNFSELFFGCGILFLAVVFCQLIKIEGIQTQPFYGISSDAQAKNKKQVEDGRKYEQSQEIKRIRVDIIRKKINQITYIRELQFNTFHVFFRIFMRKNSLLESNLHLDVGNQILGTNVKKLTKYLPVLFVGMMQNSPKSIAHGKITDTEFEFFIQHVNETYCVNCSFEKQSGTLEDFENLRHSLKNCRTHKLKKERISVMALGGNIEFASTGYKDYVTTDIYGTDHKTFLTRAKRNTPTPVTGHCVLKVMADHNYFEEVGNSDVKTTIAEMLISIATSDSIFRQTDFNGDGESDNIGFKVGNITIFSSDQDYKMKNESNSMLIYLQKFSEYNFTDYCLGIAFTNRDFDGSTVGMAYIGGSSFYQLGGICPKHSSCSRGTCKNYNTGVLTQQNFGRFISSESAALIMAHEFGHNFGSRHDSTSQCAPGGHAGNYLMYPYTSSGTLANHRLFSPCSIQSIYPVIVSKSPGCFKEDPEPICGNGILDEDEECDCGTVSMCQDIDPCCTPANSSIGTPCTLSILNDCSPKTSVCCTELCNYYHESDQVMCQEETECSLRSVCRHGQSTCPNPDIHADGTPCDEGRKTCYRGMCSKSICTFLNLTDCQCTTPSTSACLVCCEATNISNPVCAPVNSFDTSVPTIIKHRGDPCFNYKGFCNQEMKCVLEDTSAGDGFKKLLTSETAVNLGTWMKKYWFYLILTILISFLVAFILSSYFKPQQDVHMDAVRMGKLTAIIAQSQAQKQIYQEKIDACKKAFQNISMQDTSMLSIPLTLAVARMSLFFPTAPLSLIFKTVKSSSSEEFAVKMMLVRKYPMQSFVVFLHENMSFNCEVTGVHEDIEEIVLKN